MTAKFVIRVNQQHVDLVLAERRRLGIGETFKVLSWVRRRGSNGRWVS